MLTLAVPGPRAQAGDHAPWLLAALETELGPRFSAILAAASRQSSRGRPLLGVWSPEGDECRTEMLAIAPGERPDAFQEWRRVAPGGTMAPVRIGRWQQEAGGLALSIGFVSDPAGVDPDAAGAGSRFQPIDRQGATARSLWRMLDANMVERWWLVEADAERVLLRAADGTERALTRCRVALFRPDGRPAEPVLP